MTDSQTSQAHLDIFIEGDHRRADLIDLACAFDGTAHFSFFEPKGVLITSVRGDAFEIGRKLEDTIGKPVVNAGTSAQPFYKIGGNGFG